MTTPGETQALLSVTQADRDAAADFAETCTKYSFVWTEAPAIRRGEHDEWEIVQALARHREAHSPTGSVDSIVASLVRDAIDIGTDESADYAASRIKAYLRAPGGDGSIASDLEQIASDMEQAVGGGMMWIDHSEAIEFCARIRKIGALDEGRISHSLPGDVGRIVHRNGPVVVDWMGENLAWRPLDYGTWTPFEDTPSPSPGDVGTADLLEQVDMWGDCRCDGFSIGHEPDCTRRIVGQELRVKSDAKSRARAAEILAALTPSALSDLQRLGPEFDDGSLGRFGHHPEPAIDFECEVEQIESIVADLEKGMRQGEPVPMERIARAMTFRVGGDPGAVAAKATLRELEKRASALSVPVGDDLAKGLRTSQKALDEIARQEQANIAGYLALRDFPVGSASAQFPPDEVGPNALGSDGPSIAAQLREISRISNKYDLRECIEGHDDALGDSYIWRDLMDHCEKLGSKDSALSGDAGEGDFLDHLRAVNAERWAAWAGTPDVDHLYAANEFGGEAGEVLNVVKKLVREQRGWRGSRSSTEALGEEIADCIICLDSIARGYGIDLVSAVVAKFNKTSAANDFPHRITDTRAAHQGAGEP